MSREYCQYGFRSGVDSVIGSRDGGFWYADAVEMNTYCPVRPANRSMSACTCSGGEGDEVNDRVKVKTVNRSSNGPASRTSARSSRTPAGNGRSADCPRLSTNTSTSRATASRTHADEITPVPPMKRTLSLLTPPA